MRWDPELYATFADERSRPFGDLVARVGSAAPRRVVDLGCGSGELTAALATRWPGAAIEGVDSSPEMIERASARAADHVRFRLGDVNSWSMPPDADVVIGNAVLQWVPNHGDLLRAWAASLPADGWLAFQVPGNFGSPSHRLMRSLAESARWRATLAGVLRHDAVAQPADYAALLHEAGLAVDAWETTYLHLLSGADPVLDWVRGTGLRPVLAALNETEREAFVAEYATQLRRAYPPGPHGTVFPFRRIFFVGHQNR